MILEWMDNSTQFYINEMDMIYYENILWDEKELERHHKRIRDIAHEMFDSCIHPCPNVERGNKFLKTLDNCFSCYKYINRLKISYAGKIKNICNGVRYLSESNFEKKVTNIRNHLRSVSIFIADEIILNVY